MAITVVDSGFAYASGTYNFSASGVVAGDLIVGLAASSLSGGGTPTCSSSDGAVWSVTSTDGASGRRQCIGYAIAVGSGSITVTTSGTNGFSFNAFYIFRGDSELSIIVSDKGDNASTTSHAIYPTGLELKADAHCVSVLTTSGTVGTATNTEPNSAFISGLGTNKSGGIVNFLPTSDPYTETWTTTTARATSGHLAMIWEPVATGGPPQVHPLSGFGHPLGRPGVIS